MIEHQPFTCSALIGRLRTRFQCAGTYDMSSSMRYFPNRSNRYASSAPPFPSYASSATRRANGSV